MRENTISLLEIHLAVVLFGLSGLFARYVGQPAVIIAFGRVFFASSSMYFFFKYKGTAIRLKSIKDCATLAAAGLLLAVHWTAFFLSIQVSTVAIGVITFSTYPLFITFLEPVMCKERIKIADVISACIMFAGVVIIVPEFQTANNTTLGIAWGMLCSLTYAALSLINRKFAKKYSGRIIAFYEQGAASLILLPVFFLSRPSLTLPSIFLMIVLGVLFTAVAHSMFINGMRNIKAQTAGMIASLESVYGIAAAAVFLAEIPSFNELAGGILILLAAIYSTLKASKATE
ncbi:MAG: DMT family transporter [Synergistaceae bacterium]|nr:DMT family transporter [Synergistaceae bacterium]